MKRLITLALFLELLNLTACDGGKNSPTDGECKGAKCTGTSSSTSSSSTSSSSSSSSSSSTSSGIACTANSTDRFCTIGKTYAHDTAGQKPKLTCNESISEDWPCEETLGEVRKYCDLRSCTTFYTPTEAHDCELGQNCTLKSDSWDITCNEITCTGGERGFPPDEDTIKPIIVDPHESWIAMGGATLRSEILYPNWGTQKIMHVSEGKTSRSGAGQLINFLIPGRLYSVDVSISLPSTDTVHLRARSVRTGKEVILDSRVITANIPSIFLLNFVYSPEKFELPAIFYYQTDNPETEFSLERFLLRMYPRRLTEVASIKEGQQLYADKNCGSCHGESLADKSAKNPLNPQKLKLTTRNGVSEYLYVQSDNPQQACDANCAVKIAAYLLSW